MTCSSDAHNCWSQIALAVCHSTLIVILLGCCALFILNRHIRIGKRIARKMSSPKWWKTKKVHNYALSLWIYKQKKTVRSWNFVIKNGMISRLKHQFSTANGQFFYCTLHWPPKTNFHHISMAIGEVFCLWFDSISHFHPRQYQFFVWAASIFCSFSLIHEF